MAQFEDSSLLELADQISKRAKTLHDYLEKNKLGQPSLVNEHARLDFLEEGDADIQRVREELRSASRQLDALAAGKFFWAVSVVENMHDANMHRFMYYYEIPKHVPAEGSISYKELAQKTGFDEDKLKRLIRYALRSFVFIEPKDGYVAHSAWTRSLLDEKSWAWYGHLAEDCYGSIARSVEASKKWGSGTTAPNQAGLQLYFDTPDDLFTWMGKNAPERIPRFAKAMEYATDATISSVFSWDWTKLGKATVIDLGGSVGQKSIAIARRAPELTFYVQDLEETVGKAAAPPADVADRVHFEAQDFFTPQKRTDMDAVFVARVFHDWPDKDCHRILQNLVPSMKAGCRLIINDFITMPPYSIPATEDKTARVFDMHMMTIMNAKERSLEDWKALVATGGEGKLEFEWSTGGLICFIKR